MGGILSRPIIYVKTKVNNTKQAIVNKVTNTKQAIVTKVTNVRDGVVGSVRRKRDAVVTKVNNGCLAVYNGINNAGRAVVTKVTNTRDYICDTVTSTKNRDYICDTVTNTKNRVVAVKNGVVTKVNNGVAAVVHAKNVTVGKCRSGVQYVRNKYDNTKTAIHDRYTNAKNSTYERYRYYRDRKYSRWEKLLIALVTVLMFFVAIVTLLCVFDVYQGRPELAEERLRVIGERLGDGVYWTWDKLLLLLHYTWEATGIVLRYTWIGCKAAAYYAWEGTKYVTVYVCFGLKVAGQYSYHYTVIAVEKIAFVSKVVGLYLWDGMKVAAVYVGIALQVSAQYVATGSKIAGEHVVTGVKSGAHYTYQGSCVAAEYGAHGFKYSLKHGSLALKSLAIKTVQWAWYFLTNFRAASYDAAVYLWEGFKWLITNLWFGSREGTYIAWQGTKYLANTTYHGTIYSGKVTGQVIKTTYHYTVWVVKETFTGGISITNATLYFTKATVSTTTWAVKTASVEITNFTINTSRWLYHGTVALSKSLCQSTVATSKFAWDWLCKISIATAQFLYVAVNDYAAVWIKALVFFIAEWTMVIGTILWTFIRDLNLVLVRLVVAVGTQVYNVFYIVFGFLYQIVSTVTLVVKLVVKGIVYCVTSVFGGVIWVLEETIFAYTFVLHKYNMYREFLFIGVMGVIVAYCSGLMQDYAKKEESEDTDSEGDDHSQWIDGIDPDHPRDETELHHGIQEVAKRRPKTTDSEEGSDVTEEEVGKEVPSGKIKPPERLTLGQSSPKNIRFRETKKRSEPPPPKYVQRSAIPHYTDELLSDDSDVEFSLDHDVPDFMHLSDSDPEPPTPDDPPPAIDDITSASTSPSDVPLGIEDLTSSNGQTSSSPNSDNTATLAPETISPDLAESQTQPIGGAGDHTSSSSHSNTDQQGHPVVVQGHLDKEDADLEGHEADLEDSEASDLEPCDLKDSGVETS